jgi:hypothetical protein
MRTPARFLLTQKREEDAMKLNLRSGAIILALVGSTGLTVAQTTPGTSVSPGGPSASGVIDPKAGLQLTPQQRTLIFQSVSKEKDKVKSPPASTNASVGSELPASMELYTVPDAVTAEVPNTKLYKYTVVNNEVVLVDPTSMKVVEVIRQ